VEAVELAAVANQVRPLRSSLQAWLENRGGSLEDYAFPSRTNHANHIGAPQYARLVDEWLTAIGLRREDYGTHSLRRTKASIIYKATGNLRAVRILLGTPRSRARYVTSGWTSKTRSLSLSTQKYEARRSAGDRPQTVGDPKPPSTRTSTARATGIVLFAVDRLQPGDLGQRSTGRSSQRATGVGTRTLGGSIRCIPDAAAQRPPHGWRVRDPLVARLGAR
jgi:hypothetical protein